MIRQILDEELILYSKLSPDYYGRKLRAYIKSYGLCYPFCRLYAIYQEKKVGYLVVFNSGIVISSTDDLELSELERFVEMHEINTIEAPLHLAQKFKSPDYVASARMLFEFSPGKFPAEMEVNENPNLDDVFGILAEGFDLKENYDLWLTDASHTIRHGVSRIYMYKNLTTATKMWEIDDVAYFGHIATAASARGQGLARELLYWLAEETDKRGVTAQLYAQPDRRGFYEELGFIPVLKDMILNRI